MSQAPGDELPWPRILRVLMPLARPERFWLLAIVAIGIALSLAEGVGLTVGLLVIYRLLGAAHGETDEGPLGPLMVALGQYDIVTLIAWGAALTLAGTLMSVISLLLSERVANRITHRARTRIYRSYLQISYQQAIARGHGEMLDTLDYETPFLTQAVMNVAAVIVSFCAVTVFGGYVLLLSWRLGLAALILGLLLVATLGLASRRLTALGASTSGLNERLLAQTVATVQGMRTVRLHAAEDEFIRRYTDSSAALASAHVRMAAFNGLVSGSRQIGKLAAMGGLIWVAVIFAVPLEVTLTVIALLFRLVPHFSETEEQVLTLFRFRFPLSILARAIERADQDKRVEGHRPFAGLNRELRFDHVTFAHSSGAEVLRDASFSVEAGDLVTIRGPSGGGKTTMINLIARLFEPQSGMILVDGVPLGEIERKAWLDRIGFSGQDIDLQDGSVLDNVRFFDARIAEEDARWALGVAHAEFVDALPEGMHTQVGDRGLRLSGGQRQRIGLARAIVRRPTLLILDEATNAVDSALEAKIYRSIRDALPDTTMLVITHHSAVADAKAEWLLENGMLTRLASTAHAGMQPAK